jgi:osmotically-inducible protein OsmY
MQNNDLEHRVMAALQADRRLQARMFTVSAAQGVVTLGGTPPDMQQRDLALQIAGRVPGVRRVIANMPLN